VSCRFCVFAKAPERSKTRLEPVLGRDGATAFARALLADTLALAPPPVEVWADGDVGVAGARQQIEGDLGARLEHALREELSASPAVVILGTDAPTLPAAVLSDAAERLSSGACDLVLGPAADGGYYLVGATRAAAGRSELFAGIAWSTEKVMRESFARACSLGLRTAVLPWWYDVDTAEDLDLLVAHLPFLPRHVAPETRSVLAAFPRLQLK